MAISTFDADVALFLPFRGVGSEQSYVIRALQGLRLRGYRTVLIDSTGTSSPASAEIHPALLSQLNPIDAFIALPGETYRVQVAMATRPSSSAPYDRLGVAVVSQGAVLVADAELGDAAASAADGVSCRIDEVERVSRSRPALALNYREQVERFEGIGHAVLPGEWSFGAPSDAIRQPRSGARSEDRVRIGRHTSFAEPQWPEDEVVIRRSLPTTPDWDVRIFGENRRLMKVLGRIPKTWVVNHVVTPSDLEQLDFWAAAHGGEPTEMPDLGIEEAIAAGLVVLLPSSLKGRYGQGALYTTGVRSAAQALHADDRRFARQSMLAVQHATEHRAELVVERLMDVGLREPSLRPPVEVLTRAPGNGRERFRVMFVTSNGAGMGHLTRLLGIARTIRDEVDIVFASLSQASPVVQQFGFPFVYIASAAETGMDPKTWNDYAKSRFGEEIARFTPDVVVFDGTWIYSGLAAALREARIPFIWSRRGMWKSGISDRSLLNAASAAAVIEPGEFAAEFDRGATKRITDVVRTNPVTIIDRDELLDAESARERLGLRQDDRAVLITLGAGNLNSLDETVADLIAAFVEYAPTWRVFMTSNPIAGTEKAFEHVEKLSYYPVAELALAFDATVSATGYNSYHEWMMACVPTVWIPNLSTQTDDQLARAEYAEAVGVGVAAIDPDRDAVSGAVRKIVDDRSRAAMHQRLLERRTANGAREAGNEILRVLRGGA